MRRHVRIAIALALVLFAVPSAFAAVNRSDNSGGPRPRPESRTPTTYGVVTITEYTDSTAWLTAKGTTPTVNRYAELGPGVTVTNQYGPGILYTDGDDVTVDDPNALDGIALAGKASPEGGPINVQFSSPITAIGVNYPGAAKFRAYLGANPVFVSSDFGGQGAPFFAGVISDTPFDRVEISDWFNGSMFVDDLFYSVAGEPTDNPPTINCPEDTYVACDGGRGAQVSYTVSASDDHGLQSLVCTPPPGSYFPVGWSDVHCTATDNTGQTASCDFRIFVFPTECPNGPNYWKRHPRLWPVTSLTLGTIEYDQDRLIGILDLEPGGDASVRLARQLIAAKLNVENCVDPRPILKVIEESDALLTGKVPMLVPPRSPLGRDMVEHAQWLNNFNDGLLFIGCKKPSDLSNGLALEQGGAAVTMLGRNAPNPFGKSTMISWTMGKAAPGRVVVYDVGGRELKVLANGMMEAGRHTVEWDGTDGTGTRVRNGVYFYRLVTDGYRDTQKMIIVGR